jgi:hypothetical protein
LFTSANTPSGREQGTGNRQQETLKTKLFTFLLILSFLFPVPYSLFPFTQLNQITIAAKIHSRHQTKLCSMPSEETLVKL